MNEILAPAGTIESFYAAISNGANAIYLGLDKFNARAYADNFTVERLKELVKFAHLRNVKIYVTMNTLAYDFELEEIYETIDQLALIHVDALIIQDLAIFHYVVSHYKSLEAHASTQMGIDDVEGAKLAKRLGATRVVFARETPLSMLKRVKEEVDVEIEAFIHGALCVAYSGNCLMSSMIGERSGNRGRCAGCCRQVYTLVDTKANKNRKTGYLLSMKDLNVAPFVKDMGFVDSLKIEGRMKEPNYVAAVTRFYRELVDEKNPDAASLDKVFNRTYTKGFMNEDDGREITNILRPNNFGYRIGNVVKASRGKIWIRLQKELSKGDQIRVETKDLTGEISLPVTKLFDASFQECLSSKKTAIVACDRKVEIGASVYKTKDARFVEKTMETLRHPEYQKLGLKMEFTAKIGGHPSLKAVFEGFEVTSVHDFVIQEALSRSTTKENAEAQLSKLNDTPYFLEGLSFDMDENVFLSLKAINELRRDVVERLNNARLAFEVEKKEGGAITPKPFVLTEKEIAVQVSNDAQFEVAKELGIRHIYYKNVVRRNHETYVAPEEEILVGGLGGVEHYRELKTRLIADYSLNVTNHVSAGLLSSLGVERITLSSEINKDSIKELIARYVDEYHTEPDLELIVYGRTTLMHTKYCPLKRLGYCGECKKSTFALKDKFASFPLAFNEDCTVHVLNSKVLNLMDEVPSLEGIHVYRLVFTVESPEETRRVLSSFMEKMRGDETRLFSAKTDTRGHFVKNPL